MGSTTDLDTRNVFCKGRCIVDFYSRMQSLYYAVFMTTEGWIFLGSVVFSACIIYFFME